MKNLIIAIVWAVLLSLPGISVAEEVIEETEILCDNYTTIINKLKNGYAESLIYQGNISDVTMMAFYANQTTGTWTVLVHDTAQTAACLYVSGETLRKY